MVHASLLKQQDDIAGLVTEINSIKGKAEEDKASSKFDMDAMPAEYGGAGAPPVG